MDEIVVGSKQEAGRKSAKMTFNKHWRAFIIDKHPLDIGKSKESMKFVEKLIGKMSY